MSRFAASAMRGPLLVVACAIAAAGGRSWAQDPLPEGHPRYVVIRRVFDDLVQAVGDGRTPPRLRVLPEGVEGRRQVLWYHPVQNAVTMQERVYDLCVALGPDSLDALAFLLGHELAHHYKSHDWGADFALSFADLEAGETIERLSLHPDRVVQMETEADYFGGLYASVAGYSAFGAVPDVLEAIYSAYGLRDEAPGYPPLAERQEIARRALTQLRGMVPLFDAGRQLLLIERFEEAGRCFDYIARTFPSREILNGAGLARVLEVLDGAQPPPLRLAYPFELDAQTRLLARAGQERADRPGPPVDAGYRERRLAEARNWFSQARARDPAYVAACINLAGVADLQGEFEEAVYLAEKAIQLARANCDAIGEAHGLIMRGIARVHRDPGQRQAAAQDFAQAASGSPTLARLNAAALDSGAARGATAAAAVTTAGEEQIAGRAPLGFLAVIQDPASTVAEVPEVDRHEPALDVYAHRTEAWSALVVETGYGVFSFLETGPGYAGRTERGIAIGSDLAQVRAAYGPASYAVTDRQHTYHVYRSRRIAFQTDSEDRVRGWMLYSSD